MQGFRVLGFRVWIHSKGLGFTVQGFRALGFRVQDSL